MRKIKDGQNMEDVSKDATKEIQISKNKNKLAYSIQYQYPKTKMESKLKAELRRYVEKMQTVQIEKKKMGGNQGNRGNNGNQGIEGKSPKLCTSVHVQPSQCCSVVHNLTQPSVTRDKLCTDSSLSSLAKRLFVHDHMYTIWDS